MKSKIILTITGIAGALAIALSGCSLFGTGEGTVNDLDKGESQEAITETSVAEKSKETVSGEEKSKKKEEEKAAKDKSSEVSESADGDKNPPAAESSDGADTHALSSYSEEQHTGADSIAKEAQAIEEEYKRQEEEYNRQIEENKKKIEQYNAEVEAHNKRVNNYYYNPTNHIELINDVNINPGHIIYDANGDLYATCFITNGKDVPVYDINVEYIELYDANGNLIAGDGNLRIGNGGAIGGHSYNTWTFVFSGDKLKQSSADLTNTIGCKFGVAYRF